MAISNNKSLVSGFESSGAVKIKKPGFIQELGPVDISPIKNLVTGISEKTWNMENERKENDFECFHHTRHIIFRFIQGMRDHREFYSNPIWSVWKSDLLPIFETIVAPYGFRQPIYPKAMLARLEAGAEIDRHRDGAGSNAYTHKIHVPIQTNKKARMFINDRPFHLSEGYAYEVNNIVPHAVKNAGTEDRVHLIFEVFDDKSDE